MFALFNRAHPTPVLDSERLRLVPPSRSHFPEWAALREESRAFLQPWEPVWQDDELTRHAFLSRCRRARADAAAGSAHVFFIVERQSDRITGGITLGNIRLGVAQSAQIGYWMGERFAGRGLMREAVSRLVGYAFDDLGLHRLEAACIPGNQRSIKVLTSNGFTQEGLLKSYLKINGKWDDHLLFARISGVTVSK